MKTKISFLLVTILSLQASAQITSPYAKESGPGSRQGYEYFVGKDLGRPLITVSLLAGVREPGVYHVPINTQVNELISYAGGALEFADLGDIRIRRVQGTEIKLINYDLNDSFRDVTPLLTVQDRDSIHIPAHNKLDMTLKWATVIATILSVVASSILINEYQQRQ